MSSEALWALFYSDRVVTGRSREDWRAAPSEDVQVLVLMEAPAVTERRWTNVSDRKIWTGDSEYELHPGWGVKKGRLLPDSEYDRIWREAFYGDINP